MTATTHTIWQLMHLRCTDPSFAGFEHYGGRGIRVCKRWEKFENFFADMGERRTGMTIERLDTNGNYVKRNCRWMSGTDNGNNKRTCVYIECAGMVMTATEWARALGMDQKLVIVRLGKGWTAGEAIATPTGHRGRLSTGARRVTYGEWRDVEWRGMFYRVHVENEAGTIGSKVERFEEKIVSLYRAA